MDELIRAMDELISAKLKHEQKLNEVYRQRNELAVALAKMAILAGLKAGKAIDANEAFDMEWRYVVYVELPNGKQVSWHMSSECVSLVESLPDYEGQWDGSFLGREFGWSQQITGAATVQ